MQSLFPFGPKVSQKMSMYNNNVANKDDGHKIMTIAHMAL